MSSLLLGSSAGALALLYYLQQRKRTSITPVPHEAPSRWSNEAPDTPYKSFLFYKDVFSFMLTQTVGRWHTMDLFVGLTYLAHRAISGYPAADIAERGVPISLDPTPEQASALMAELEEIRRYMLYCRGLKHKRADLQHRFWIKNLSIRPDQIIRHEESGWLRPAYVLIRDEKLRVLLLCIRGTQDRNDVFTSLTGATKPHHMVTEHGVVLGYSHQGMLTAARNIFRQLVPPQGPSPLLSALVEAGPGFSLRVVGHSMGGGTAAMLTMMLREHKALDARCVALACPACMTLELAQSCRDFVTTVINGTDIVPTFCSATVDTLREDVRASSWFLEFQKDLRSSVAKAWQGGVRGMGSASQWTSRNILQPVSLPFRSCYSLSRIARTSCSSHLSAGPARSSSRDELLIATGMDELLLLGLPCREAAKEDEDASRHHLAASATPVCGAVPLPGGAAGAAGAAAGPPPQQAPLELRPPSGLHSRRPSKLSLPELQQQQQQLLPTSPLSEETMAETLYSCLYAGRLEVNGSKPGRRRAGRRWPSRASSSPSSSAGPSERLQGTEGGADGLDLQQAYRLLEEAGLGLAAGAGPAVAPGDRSGVNGPGDGLQGPGGVNDGINGVGGPTGPLSSVAALRRRLGLWAGEHAPQPPQLLEEQGQDKEQEKEEQRRQRGLQGLGAEPPPKLPLRAKLQGVQRAALSAGLWLWDSVTAAGATKQGAGEGGAGNPGLETLADNGAGASLLLPTTAAKPAGDLHGQGEVGREWEGREEHGVGLRPRRHQLGLLREQVLAKGGGYAQQGEAWQQQQQQQQNGEGGWGMGLGEPEYEDDEDEGSEGSREEEEEEEEDELEIGVDAAQGMDGREWASLHKEQGSRGRGDAGGSSHDDARHQLEAGITAVVAAVTNEAGQQRGSGDSARHDAEEDGVGGGDGADGSGFGGGSVRGRWGSSSQEQLQSAACVRGVSAGAHRSWSEEVSLEQLGLEGGLQGGTASSAAGAGARHMRGNSRSFGFWEADHRGRDDHAEEEVCGGGSREGLAGGGQRAEAGRALTQPVYAPKRLYPAGRIQHFFPLSVLPGYELQQEQQPQQPPQQQQPQGAPTAGAAGVDGTQAAAPGCGPPQHHRFSSSSNSLFNELGGNAAWDAGAAAAACAEDPVAAAVAAAAAAAVGRNKSNASSARTPGPAARDESGLLLADVAPAPQPWVLIEVPHHEAYGRVKLCKRMVVDHFVYSYLQALDSVMAQLQGRIGKCPNREVNC